MVQFYSTTYRELDYGKFVRTILNELKLSEGESEVFVDVAGDSPGEFESEGVANPVLNLEPEPCSTDSINAHKSSGGKYYAVRRGYRPGEYLSWSEYKVQVDGFSGAEHKSFKSYQEAEHYVVVAASKIYSRVSQSSTRERLS